MITFFNNVLCICLYSVCRCWFGLFFNLHASTYIQWFSFDFCSHFHIPIFHILSNDNSLSFISTYYVQQILSKLSTYIVHLTSSLFTIHGVNKMLKSSTSKGENSAQRKNHSVWLYFMQHHFVCLSKISSEMRF